MKKKKTPHEILVEYLENTPQEEINALIDKVDAMEIGGPTVKEYFDMLKKMKLF